MRSLVLGDSNADLSAVADGAQVELTGWVQLFPGETTAGTHFLLVDETPCCAACLPQDNRRWVEARAQHPLIVAGRRRFAGTLRRTDRGYCLTDARPVGERLATRGLGRRDMLAASVLACVAVMPRPAMPQTAPVDPATARERLRGLVSVDAHTHAGRLIGVRAVRERLPFLPVATPMRDGGMAAICAAIVPDAPTQRVAADHLIHPYRDPDPGELYAFATASFERLHALIAGQKLRLIATAADLAAARAEQPSVIVASEGADFLEGRIDRVEEAYRRWKLRHLQLTHYRVNELGDIQTEAPAHGGLTDFGAEVVRSCNRLGIVVDVAHGTFDLVKRAAGVTKKPLVLSHTSLSRNPGPRSRTISADHARLIAQTGGVIGIWPPSSVFPDKAALAEGMARMVDVVGIDHVGLGSDMGGLVGPSSFAGYAELPDLAAALLAHGFSQDEMARLLGGNYLRVFGQSLA